MRLLAIIGLFIALAISFVGCRMSLGKQELLFRPGFRVPARAVEEGDGDRVVWEKMEPEGDAMFVFVRGEL